MWKYKFVLLILLAFCNSKVFSQSDTVRIPKYQAVAATQDLIRYDGLKQLYELVKEQLKEKDVIIAAKDRQILSFEKTIENNAMAAANMEALRKNSELAYKRQVKKNRLLVVIIGGLIGYAGYSTFK